jgi:hypothetical protein
MTEADARALINRWLYAAEAKARDDDEALAARRRAYELWRMTLPQGTWTGPANG